MDGWMVQPPYSMMQRDGGSVERVRSGGMMTGGMHRWMNMKESEGRRVCV